MRVKQLEVIGLKSFANKTLLNFDPGVTAIVGPNGCGKSNVVDAIRWVLGEQSARHLRGDSMEDVIFKGNDRTPAAGMAQVSLTFENDPSEAPAPQGDEDDIDVSSLPAHFRNLTEITVSRRLYRSGESEYYINRTACRLKDITELFLGTGIGSRAYAIIEQGRVEQLIQAKPEDRRLFIEEAAGTTLFRSRKLAAERKIERTRENLLRVNDVLHELERQIQYLHRMAKRAEQFRVLQAEFRELGLGLGALEFHTLSMAIEQADLRLTELRSEESRLVEQLRETESSLGERRIELASTEEHLAQARESAATLAAEGQSLEQRDTLLRREIDERQRRSTRFADESATLVARHSQVETEIADLRLNAERMASDLEEATQAAAASGSSLASVQADLTSRQQEAEQLRGKVLSLAAEEAETRNQQTARTRRREDLARRLERLGDERRAVEQQTAAAEHGAALRRAEIAEDRRKLDLAENDKRVRAENVRTLAERRRQQAAELERLGNDLARARSQWESLEHLRQTYEGYQGGVRSLLLSEQRSPGIFGVVGELFSAPAQYEKALAAALAERLQFVVTRDSRAALDAVEVLRRAASGRGSFIPASPRALGATAAAAHVRLLDHVQVDGEYRALAESLLGDVVLVDTLEDALLRWQQDSDSLTFVTLTGEVIDARGVVTGGSDSLVEEAIVARHRLLAELAADVERLTGERAKLDAEAIETAANLESEQAALAASDKDAHGLALRLVSNEKDAERLTAAVDRLRHQTEVIVAEMGLNRRETAEIDQEAVGLAERLERLRLDNQDVHAALEAAQQQRTTLALRADELRAEATRWQVQVAEITQRHEAARKGIERLARELAELATRQNDLAGERQRVAGELEGLQAEVVRCGEEREVCRARHEEVRQQVADLQAALAAQADAVAAGDAQGKQLRQSLDEVRKSLGQCEVALAEHRMRLDHVVQGVRERYDADVAEQTRFEGSEEEESQARTRLEELRGKLVRLGEVNIGAIDELRELEERAGFLRTQKADLEHSIADLERTIQKLNKASRARFAETFESVNQKFQEVLPRLFRGGEGRLVLTNEDDLLESGVDIVVKPPGKRLDTVSLLSGGEKALVAVSLIFSLFLTSPTPFCILDEVDAPLDEANIGRFTALVHEMSQHTQFIVITHNKRTMEVAQVMYGVTMQEPGVSKVISVATR